MTLAKTLAFLLVPSLFSQPAHAETQPLGRLILTPQERVDLEQQRTSEHSVSTGNTLHGELRRGGQLVERWSDDATTSAEGLPVGDSSRPDGQHDRLLGDGAIHIRLVPESGR